MIGRNFATPPAELEEIVQLAMALSRSPEYPYYAAALVKGMKSALQTNILPYLKEVTCPVHIVWGSADRVFPMVWLPDFLAALPGSTGEVLSGCGHYPNIECAGAFDDALSRFIAGLEKAVV